MSTEALLDKAFATLEAAAIAGERCPQAPPHGNMRPEYPRDLARAGRIKIEIYMHNWRVVTIMEGPNKGKHTLLPSRAGKPYRVIYKDHIQFGTVRALGKTPITLPKIGGG
jgi:hypothetical protein